MNLEYRSDDWDTYPMVTKEPHRELEPLEKEIAVVDDALDLLHVSAGAILRSAEPPRLT